MTASVDLSRVRRIWVRAPNWLGDVVMATATFARLRAAFPHAHVTAGMRPFLRPLVADSGFFDAIVDTPRLHGARALWREVASAPGLHRVIAGALGAEPEGSLWVGTEGAAAAEAPFWPGGRRVHWLSPGPRPADPCKGARHVAAPDLASDPAALAGEGPFARAALSQVARWLPEASRRAAWAALRGRAQDGARLGLVDSFEAPGAVEADGKPPPAFSAAGVCAELEASGWRLRRRPAPLAGGAFTWLVAEAA